MKKVAYAAVIAVIVLVAVGCATMSLRAKPKPPDEGTLLIGQVQIEFKSKSNKWRSHVADSGLTVFLYDIVEVEEYKLTTYDDGVFYIVFPNERKEIFIHGFRRGIESSHTDIKYSKRVTLYPGKANNVGHFTCTAEIGDIVKRRGNYIEREVTQDVKVDYEGVRKWLQSTFPDSAWNYREWVRVPHYKLNETKNEIYI